MDSTKQEGSSYPIGTDGAQKSSWVLLLCSRLAGWNWISRDAGKTFPQGWMLGLLTKKNKLMTIEFLDSCNGYVEVCKSGTDQTLSAQNHMVLRSITSVMRSSPTGSSGVIVGPCRGDVGIFLLSNLPPKNLGAHLYKKSMEGYCMVTSRWNTIYVSDVHGSSLDSKFFADFVLFKRLL